MIQNKSIAAFFTLIKAGLFGRTEDAEKLLQEGVDWAEVYQLAKEQGVVGLATEGIETFHAEWLKTHSSPLVPKEWTLKFVGATLKLEKKNIAMNHFIALLANELRKKDVKTLLLKGQELATCYEKPLWRTCGDVDLLLNQEDYQKAKEYLLPLASLSEQENAYKNHLGLKLGKWVVELHGSLRCGFSFHVDKELDKMYNDTLSGGHVELLTNKKVQIFKLEKENNVLYVFAHFLNHFYKGGVGIKQICDWSRLLWTCRDTLDLKHLDSRLKNIGLVSEWKAFGMFAVEYLGMPEHAMPFYVDEKKWRRKAKRIHSFVIKTGNLGHNRQGNPNSGSYLTRKIKSSWQRICDLEHHFMIFPVNALRFFPGILLNGLRQK